MAEYAGFLTALPENGGFIFRNDRGRKTIRAEKRRIVPYGPAVRGIKHHRIQDEDFAAGEAVCVVVSPQFPGVGAAREIEPDRRRQRFRRNGAEEQKIRTARQQFRLREISHRVAEKGESAARRTHAAVPVDSHGLCFLRAVVQKDIAAGKASDAAAPEQKRQIVESLTAEFLRGRDPVIGLHNKCHGRDPPGFLRGSRPCRNIFTIHHRTGNRWDIPGHLPAGDWRRGADIRKREP